MAHAQKPNFVFQRNGQVHLNRRGVTVQSTTGSQGVHISGSNAGYTMFQGNVKSTGYLLHLPVSPSLPLPRITVCHHISTGLCSFTSLSYVTDFLTGLLVSVICCLPFPHLNLCLYTTPPTYHRRFLSVR